MRLPGIEAERSRGACGEGGVGGERDAADPRGGDDREGRVLGGERQCRPLHLRRREEALSRRWWRARVSFVGF